MGKYDLEKFRKGIKEQGGKFKDPTEFRPPKVSEGSTLKYRFFVLPPIEKGDKCADGTASQTMEMFFIQNGSHKINNQFYPCPRVHNGDDCPLCQLGFDLMSESQDKKYRSKIAKNYMPFTRYAANVYFPNTDANPEELRGKVMWMNASKTLYDKWEDCLMRDDEGDPDDPEPHGIFFDEESAYLFQLEIKSKSGWNDYSPSKFMANLGKMPIAAKKVDGKKVADSEKIQAILDKRHDIFTKFDEPDVEKLAELAAKISNGDYSSGDDDDDGFDDEPKSKPSRSKNNKPVDDDIVGELGEDIESSSDDTDDIIEESKEEKPKEEKTKSKPKNSDDIDAELEGLLDEIS